MAQESPQIQRLILGLCAMMLLSVTLLGNPTALARPDRYRSYQESPLSPLATPLTSTTTTVTTHITAPLSVTAPLPGTATAPVTDASAELAADSVVASTVDLVNRGQISLLLVGAVLVGILLVVGLVIGRQR